MDPTLATIVSILLTLGGYFIGRRVRDMTHIYLPLKEPVTWILIIISAMPWLLKMDMTELDTLPVSAMAGFWTGYFVGYISNQVDLIYVAVNLIASNEENADSLVTYRNSQGELCWQPQTFWGACRVVFFHVHNPLSLSANIQRTRKLRVHKELMPKIQVNVVDVAQLEIHNAEEYARQGIPKEKNPMMVKRGPFYFAIESRVYTPSPIDILPPGAYWANATGVDELTTEVARYQMQTAENQILLEKMAMDQAMKLLNALITDSPSKEFVEELGAKFRDMDTEQKKQIREYVEEEAEQNV